MSVAMPPLPHVTSCSALGGAGVGPCSRSLSTALRLIVQPCDEDAWFFFFLMNFWVP
jgi:hypothetical protein